MTAISIVGLIGLGFDIREIHDNIGSWNLTWFEFGFILLVVSFWVVVIKLILRLNKYEKARPHLTTKLISFPQSGMRIVRVSEGQSPLQHVLYNREKGYAKIAVKNNGGLLENCIGTVTAIAAVDTRNGIRIDPLVFTSSQLLWDDNNTTKNIPNDGVERYLNLAYLDQNKPDAWQLAIPEMKEYFQGWHKVDVTISSATAIMEPIKVEIALGFGIREDPPPPLNLWSWDKWYEASQRDLKQALDKVDSQT